MVAPQPQLSQIREAAVGLDLLFVEVAMVINDGQFLDPCVECPCGIRTEEDVGAEKCFHDELRLHREASFRSITDQGDPPRGLAPVGTEAALRKIIAQSAEFVKIETQIIGEFFRVFLESGRKDGNAQTAVPPCGCGEA